MPIGSVKEDGLLGLWKPSENSGTVFYDKQFQITTAPHISSREETGMRMLF